MALDLLAECGERLRPGIVFVQGSQSDREILDRIIREYGPFDLIVDDASHFPVEQQASFDALWPAVKEGGLYVVEDVQMASSKPWRFNKPRHVTTDEVFRERVKKLMHFSGPTPGPAVTFYRNAIFIYKPVGYSNPWTISVK